MYERLDSGMLHAYRPGGGQPALAHAGSGYGAPQPDIALMKKGGARHQGGQGAAGNGKLNPAQAGEVGKSVDDLPLVSPTYAELKAINAGTKLQAHHIMPQYLGKMLGYTNKDMLDHPATLITQFSHTGKINPNAMHKAISKYLPPMVGGKKANYTADQIRSGLQSAYSDIGRPELSKSVSHLIK